MRTLLSILTMIFSLSSFAVDESLLCFSEPFQESSSFYYEVTNSLDLLWLENTKNPKQCRAFVESAMRTGSPERGSFDQVRTRLNAIYESSDSDKSHMFFRAFPDIYYSQLNTNQELSKDLAEIKDHSGLILGDVHVENFGIIKVNHNNQSKYKLMVNDFDEAGNGPYYSDVLRLISSAKLAEKNLRPRVIDKSLNCALDAYKAALTGKFSVCSGVNLPTKRVEKRVEKAEADFQESFNPTNLDKMSAPCDEVSKDEIVYFTAEIPAIYMEGSTSYKHRCKKTGGSGLLRSAQYIKTEQIDNRTRYMVMETKPVSRKSAVYQYEPGKNRDHASSISKSLELYGLDETIRINGEESKYLSREKDGGNKSYRPYKVGKEDKIKRASEMLLDQFFTLGQMHKKSLDRVSNQFRSDYLEKLKKIEKLDWESSSNLVVAEFDKFYAACSPLSSR